MNEETGKVARGGWRVRLAAALVASFFILPSYFALADTSFGPYNPNGTSGLGTNLPLLNLTGSPALIFGGNQQVLSFDSIYDVLIGGGNGPTTTGGANVGIGYATLAQDTLGMNNVAIGYYALFSNYVGQNNTAIGENALQNLGNSGLSGGSNNVAVGQNSGAAYTGIESSNIVIGARGTLGENNIIRIGAGQTDTYLTGVMHGNGGGLTNVPLSGVVGNIPLPTYILTNFNSTLVGNVFPDAQWISAEGTSMSNVCIVAVPGDSYDSGYLGNCPLSQCWPDMFDYQDPRSAGIYISNRRTDITSTVGGILSGAALKGNFEQYWGINWLSPGTNGSLTIGPIWGTNLVLIMTPRGINPVTTTNEMAMVTIDGGPTNGIPVTTNNAWSWTRSSIYMTPNQPHTVVITESNSACLVIGCALSLWRTNGFVVCNMGWAGTTANQWTGYNTNLLNSIGTNSYYPNSTYTNNFFAALKVNATFYDLGKNDYIKSNYDLVTYGNALSCLYLMASNYGPVEYMNLSYCPACGPDTNTVSIAQFNNVVYQNAANYHVGVFDFSSLWPTNYLLSIAYGYFAPLGGNTHPTTKGNSVWEGAIANDYFNFAPACISQQPMFYNGYNSTAYAPTAQPVWGIPITSTATIPTNQILAWTGTATNWTYWVSNGIQTHIATNVNNGGFISTYP